MEFKGTNGVHEISSWGSRIKASSVDSLEGLFYNARRAKPACENWDVSDITNMARLFEGARHALSETGRKDLSSWCVQNVKSFEATFAARDKYFDYESARGYYSSHNHIDTSVNILMNPIFGSSWEQPNTFKSATSLSRMFDGTSSATSVIVTDWKFCHSSHTVDNADMSYMFRGAFNPVSVATWNVDCVTKMREMFGYNS